MSERVPVLDALLGKELTGYYREDERTVLRFSDGTCISFDGYYSYPTSDEDLQAIWREEYDFVEAADE